MRIIGHRGARGEAPENTLAGLSQARAAGIRDFEVDLRLTRDRQLALMHDATLERTTGRAGRVEEHTLAALQALPANRGFPRCRDRVTVPSLSEVLRWSVSADVRSLQLEIKCDAPAQHDALVEALIRDLRAFPECLSRVWLTSLDHALIDRLRREPPYPSIGLVVERPAPVSTLLARARDTGASHLVMHWRLCLTRPHVVHHAHAAGLTLSVWTVNASWLLKGLDWLGVDEVITDYPARFHARGT